jgi:hypothetical protein
MADLNRAYAVLRDEPTRAAHDRNRRTIIAGISVPMSARPPTMGSEPAPGSILGFGRYSGWSLRDVARRDPDYLLWLARHSSGIRYRTEIYGILRTTGVSAA